MKILYLSKEKKTRLKLFYDRQEKLTGQEDAPIFISVSVSRLWDAIPQDD